MPRRCRDGGAVKKAFTASIAPAIVLAAGGTTMAGGNGPVKGIRIAGVVIEDASSRREEEETRDEGLAMRSGRRLRSPLWTSLDLFGSLGIFLGPSFSRADCVGAGLG
jgi:hypothetical protein